MNTVNINLMTAAIDGDEATIRDILLRSPSDAKIADTHGKTALIKAAQHQHLHCLKLLLPVSDALAADSEGWTALMWSAAQGHAAGLELLLPFSNTKAATNLGLTSLMWATYGGHTICLEHLLPLSDIKIDAEGRTALMYAAKGGNASCLRFLLPVSNISARDKWGLSAADLAAFNSHPKLEQIIDAYSRSRAELLLLNSSTPHALTSHSRSLRI